MPVLQERQDQPVRGGARHPGQGRDARWHHPLQLQRPADLPLYGLLDLQRIHGGGRSLAGQDQPGRQSRACLPAGLRRDHRHRRVHNTAKVQPGDSVAIFGLGGIGLAAIQGARQAKAGRIIAIDTNPAKFDLARTFGATECLNPKDFDKPIHEVLIEMTGWGVDHTFECIGNVDVMRSALEAAHRGWGQSIVIGVAGAGKEISTRPFQLVTGRTWKGSAFGGVKGRTQLPGMVEDAMKGEIDLAPFVTHTMGLDDINKAFDLMHEGKSIRTVIHY